MQMFDFEFDFERTTEPVFAIATTIAIEKNSKIRVFFILNSKLQTINK